ncbi:unnamed protein product [Orchesella dallaii]|uniref:BTB domain-containing protein n=1 Tax=Orchesella dallaii TaxID=48710 RepID=A0ABP1QV22_9HEXA
MNCHCQWCTSSKKMAASAYDDDIVCLSPADENPLASKLPEPLFKEWKMRRDQTQTYEQFLKSIIANGTLADIRFIFRANQRVHGHKAILAPKSEVFSAMFSERWFHNEEVDLTSLDVRRDDFVAFLEFLYIGKASVTSPNVLALYHLADMYAVNELKEKCDLYLRDNIDEDNVFTILKSVLACDFRRTSETLAQLISFICGRGEVMLDRKELQNLDQSTLALIFSRGRFECTPLKVLRFCLGWTVKTRGRSVLRNLRELDEFMQDELGLRIKHDIPRMWYCSYTYCCVQPDVVSPEKEHHFCRFGSCSSQSGKLWTYRPNHPDRVSFRVSDTIALTGIGLYGDSRASQDGDQSNVMRLRSGTLSGQSYEIELKIYPHGQQHKQLVYLKSMAGSNMDISKMFKIDLHFRKPVRMYPNEWYTIQVSMIGPSSYFGQEGYAEKVVICGGIPIVFEFKEAESSKDYIKTSNPTGVPIGQIPKLFFKIPETLDDDDIQVL